MHVLANYTLENVKGIVMSINPSWEHVASAHGAKGMNQMWRSILIALWAESNSSIGIRREERKYKGRRDVKYPFMRTRRFRPRCERNDSNVEKHPYRTVGGIKIFFKTLYHKAVWSQIPRLVGGEKTENIKGEWMSITPSWEHVASTHGAKGMNEMWRNILIAPQAESTFSSKFSIIRLFGIKFLDWYSERRWKI